MQSKTFAPDAFVQKYGDFIKELQAMPSSPYIVLASPIYTAASVLAEKNK